MGNYSPSTSNLAYFSLLLPDIQTLIGNQFNIPNLPILQDFTKVFGTGTTFLQLSTSQIAVSGGGFILVFQGNNLSIPGATLLSNPNTVSLSSIQGTVTAAELYQGGTFSTTTQTVSGGTLVGSATFSSTQLQLTSGTFDVTITGTNLPTTPAAVGQIEAGTYTGPTIDISNVLIQNNNGAQQTNIAVTATDLVITSGPYKLTLAGTFPSSLSATLIDQLVTSAGSPSLLGVTVTSATLVNTVTGAMLLDIPQINDQVVINAADIPGTIMGLASAAVQNNSVVVTVGSLATPLDATLNFSTITVAGSVGSAATVSFQGDSIINGANPSVDRQATITNGVAGATAAVAANLSLSGIFINAGTILADGPSGSSLIIGATAISTIDVNGTTITYGTLHNRDLIEATAGNQLLIDVSSGATLVNSGMILADGGIIGIKAQSSGGVFIQRPGFAIIKNGGTIETDAAGTISLNGSTDSFVFADGAAGDTLKIDNPGSFGGRIIGFRTGDTIDLGQSLAVSQIVYNDWRGVISLQDSAGAVLSTLAVTNPSAFANMIAPGTTIAVDPTSHNAGLFNVATGANGDTILTATVDNVATVTATPTGTITPPNLLAAGTIEIGGTAAAAAITMTGGTGISLVNPSIDRFSQITNQVPGQGAGAGIINAVGPFVNDGTIIANGPTGSSLTLNLSANGILPGYASNHGLIEADAGNAITINVGSQSVLYNAGRIVANAGSVLINVSSAALDGGFALVQAPAIIEGGGTIEIANALTSGAAGLFSNYIFADSTAGNLLKIDNLSRFSGFIRGFAAGDTIDIGTSLAIASIVAGSTLGPISVVQFENSAGSVVAALNMSGFIADGTFAVSGGQADGLIIATGADGNTLIETTVQPDVWTGGSGSLQNTAGWSLGSLPGTADVAAISLTGTAPMVLTTDSATAFKSLELGNPNALLKVNSNTSIAQHGILDLGGTIEVTGGNTLTAASLLQLTAATGLLLDQASVFNVTGALNDGITNGIATLVQGSTIGARFSGLSVINGGTLNAGPTLSGGSGGSVYIGVDNAGAPASVTVENGGVVNDTFTYIGSSSQSYGSLVLTGASTQWTDLVDPNDPLNSRGYIVVGENVDAAAFGTLPPPGIAGAANLTVENGATLTDTRAYIATTGSTAGNATVSTGGQWIIGPNGGFLAIANGGNGALSVVNGGTVTVGNLAAYPSPAGTFISNGVTSFGAGIGIGYAGGGAGNILVDGLGSTLEDANGLAVGNFGTGAMTVQNQGYVGAWGTLVIGNGATGFGTVTVAGYGTSLEAAGGITVGYQGHGSLSITQGGNVDPFGSPSTIPGGLALGGSSFGPTSGVGLVSLTTGGIMLMPSVAIWAGSTLSIDNSSGLAVGYNQDIWLGAVNIESGATLIGDGVVNASALVTGTVVATNNADTSLSTGGTLEITGNLFSSAATATSPAVGNGQLVIAADATLRIDGVVNTGPTIVFAAGQNETLILGTPNGGLQTPVQGLGATDRIELAGQIITGATLAAPNTVAVLTNIGTYTLSDVSFATGSPQTFTTGVDTTTGLSFFAVTCFAAGTRIATADGDKPVEALHIGDRVRTVLDGPLMPVDWIGVRHVDCRRHPQPRKVWPVRVAADTFGPGLPARDLYLSPDHALYLNEVLIPVRLLINGTTIVQTPVDTVTYYHVELPRHDVLLAEGLPAESYLDVGDRGNFSNAPGPVIAHPDFAALRWEADGCAPMVVTGPTLIAARALADPGTEQSAA